ncbi:Na(+)/H(+) antiporter subunit C [Nakamurella flavida]|uniref:Na(+)/H(+) antiporter subunit C n=1 Tax=Nakamurella flavida TaxID=363630 RepID=A0A939C6P5_9ACTN|nr:Na(+)/H(+) antiporter subunit C [Nakamurella flavida]MBM9478334.1 Na(+)/H(+) antiporter subunit C [Nakamurella flavida]MDP9777494.1 multicomponent Na+:H+ antiporter subunit C [Nakamurella flavida]
MTTNLIMALTIGALFAAGVYLMLSRNLVRVLLGFLLVGHSVNLLLLSSGTDGEPPIVGEVSGDEAYADPLPQALILTSIVISLAVTAFLLAMVYRNYRSTSQVDVQDDPDEDLVDSPATGGEE